MSSSIVSPEPCIPGFFRAPWDLAAACQPWTTCAAGQFLAAAGTDTADVVCRDGEFWAFGPATARAVAVDSNGDIYVAGHAGDEPAFPPGASADGFLRKVDATGTLLWSQYLGTSADDAITALGADALGNVYVGGVTGGDLDALSLGAHDAFVRKLNSAGDVIWKTQFGSDAQDSLRALSVGPDGSAAVVGSDALGAFVRQWDANGNLQWTQPLVDAEGQTVAGVGVGGNGTVVVTGSSVVPLEGGGTGWAGYARAFTFDGTLLWTQQFTNELANPHDVAVTSSGEIVVVGDGLGGAFIVRLDSLGSELWQEFFTGGTEVYTTGVAVAANGHSYTTGRVYGLLGPESQGRYDIYLRQHDANGQLLSTQQVGTASDDYAYDVALGGGFAYIAAMSPGFRQAESLRGLDADIVKLALP